MTTGVVTRGDYNGSISEPYYYKSWLGADGKRNPDGSLKQNAYNLVTRVTFFTPAFDGSFSSCSISDNWRPSFQTNPNLYASCLDKLIAQINGHSVNLGNDLATANQTVVMVATTAKRFSSCIKNIRTGNIPAAVLALGATPIGKHRSKRKPPLYAEASSLWLEMQYGWKPLLSDVYDSFNRFVINTKNERQWTARAVVRHKTEAPLIWDTSNPYISRGTSGRYLELYKLSATHVEVLSTARSLGLDDPLSIAWEVLPWSFVVDWFIPIGNYFNEIHQLPNIRAEFRLSHSIRHNETYMETAWDESANQWRIHINNTTRFTYVRSGLLTSLEAPIPSPKFLTKVLSLGHMENALALLSQQISHFR